jgi:glucosamine kinase
MKLIADIGATNSRWLVGDTRLDREGYNPHTHDPAVWNAILTSLGIDPATPLDAKLYGAGFHGHQLAIVEAAFRKIFPHTAHLYVAEDLLGACHGMAQDQEAMVVIMGTGSNSCRYNGKKIVENINSMGFILGDEGSASAIGKAVIIAYLRRRLPADLQQAFDQKYKFSDADIISGVYQQKANQYIGQFSKFAHEHKTHPYMHELLKKCLGDLFALLAEYKANDLPHHFTGSVAVHFQDILQELCKKNGIDQYHIVPDYLNGLAVYHADQA